MLVAAAQSLDKEATNLELGERRPDFELKDLEGKFREISQWDGKLIVLNFWATWCPPCLHEISNLR